MTYEVERAATRIIRALYNNGQPNKALLASLRHAATLNSQQAQAVWPIMLSNLDQEQLSHNGVPTRAEIATYTAIRLYAIHQQSREQSMYASVNAENMPGIQLFTALALLRKNDEQRAALDRRVQALLATTNVNGVINELAHLVQIFKGNNQSQTIDYARLAQDLYSLQASYEQANRVRLRWGQQYFWRVTTAKGEND